MKIEYELKPLTTRGILLSKEPAVLIDRKVILSFSLPSKTVTEEEYFAIITDQDGNAHTLRLNNMQCALPDKLIKPQALRIQVIKVADGETVKRWNCQGIRLAVLDDMLRLTYEAGIDYNALQEQYSALVSDIEKIAGELSVVIAENEALRQEVSKQKGELKTEISTDIVGLLRYKELNTNELKKIVNAVNALTDELNNLKSELNI